MCGRYASSRSAEDLTAAFDADDEFDDIDRPGRSGDSPGGPLSDRPGGPVASWNVAPTDPVPIVRRRRPGQPDRSGAAATRDRELRLARWGLVPSWAADRSLGSRRFNARAETVVDKPAFRAAFARRRCLVPADGWYEWVRSAVRPAKHPVFLTPRDGSVLALAGLWETWLSPAGPLRTCAIVTTAAVGGLREVHHRMPLLLAADQWAAWLGDDVGAAALLRPPAAELVERIEVRPVGPAVGNVRNNGPELVRRVVPVVHDQLSLM
jgi:putative SOS response-associated peptidase YedK